MIRKFLVPGSNKGADRCYSIANVRGDQFGNCGHSSTAFRTCSSKYIILCIRSL